MSRRRCQVLTDGQQWRECPVSDVRAGQVFRLFEADGSPVRDADGHARWRALTDASPRGEVHAVEAVAVPETDVERAATRGVGYFPHDVGPSWRGLSARGGGWR